MTEVDIERETFSSVDAAWLHMDTPTNLAMINGVLTFSEPLEFERLKTTLEERFLIHKRFRQLVREPSTALGLPRWETDPDFDIHEHLLRLTLPEPGDHSVLQDMVSELMSKPLDPAKPLWQFHLVEKYLHGSALICRLHHCIADGLALVQVLLATTDARPNAVQTEKYSKSQRPETLLKKEKGALSRVIGPLVKATSGMGQTWRTAGDLVNEGMETLGSPFYFVDLARVGTRATMALGKLLLIGPDRKTALRGRCGIPKRAAWSEVIKVEDVKAIGQMMGGTINDILLSAVSGALRRYLEGKGEPTHGLNIRAIVPVNLRPPGDKELMGNRFGLVFLSLPVGVQDPLKRLVVLRRRMNAIKRSPEAMVAFGILGAIGLTPTKIEDIIVAIFGMKGTAVMTNVPGPRQPLYMAGSRISNLMFWVPTPGNLGLGVSIVSYAGDVTLGVATDEGLVSDPEAILEAFHEELESMRLWGRSQKISGAGKRSSTASAQSPQIVSHGLSHSDTSFLDEGTLVQCQALTKSGRQCKNRAMAGSTTCRTHSQSAD